MRLVDVETLRLESFTSETEVPYAILSHCWGEEEVLFQNMVDGTAPRKKGYFKIERFCGVTKSEGLRYAWIDTCCIDKSSSAELSEAINSMFRWYRQVDVCFAYIHDCPGNASDGPVSEDQLDASKWFKRGWTLQELIAPADVVFLSAEWKEFSTKRSLADRISIITNIHARILEHSADISSCSVAQRFSWAAGRVATRPEDRAYSLMGLFDVNMPMLYGEGGEKAFLRLQLEILRQVDDQTILAWELRPKVAVVTGLLATSPDCFELCSDITQREFYETKRRLKPTDYDVDGFSHQLVGQFIKLNSWSLQLQRPANGRRTLIKPTGLRLADEWLTYIIAEVRKFAHEQMSKYDLMQQSLYGYELRAGVHVVLLEKCLKGEKRAVGIILCSELGNVSRVHLPRPSQPMLNFDLNDLHGLSRRSFYVLTHYKGFEEEPIPVIRLRTQPVSYYLQSSSPKICARQEPCPDLPHWCVNAEERLLTGAGDSFTPLLQPRRLIGVAPTSLRTFSLCFHPKPEQFTRDILPPPFRLVFSWGVDDQIRMAFRVGRDAEADGNSSVLPDASGAVNFTPQTHKLNDDLVVVVKLRQGAGHNYQLQVAVEGAEALQHGKPGR